MQNTKQGQRLPFPQAVGRCTCCSVNICTIPANCALCGRGAEVPAGDLEGSAKDLGANKLRHDDLVAEAAREEEVIQQRDVL